MSFRDKIIPWDALPEWRKTFRASGKKLVVTNGCFDILHPGHVKVLTAARASDRSTNRFRTNRSVKSTRLSTATARAAD